MRSPDLPVVDSIHGRLGQMHFYFSTPSNLPLPKFYNTFPVMYKTKRRGSV